MRYSDLERVDSSAMFKVYDQWPEIAERFFNMEAIDVSFEGIDHFVFGGMGGSGVLGDIYSSILSKSSKHVSVVKGYLLPNTVDSNSLVVVTSVSGNTAESLKILRDAYRKKYRILAFSAGGETETFCQKRKIPFVRIEKQHSPRASLASLLYSSLNALAPVVDIRRSFVNESIRRMGETKHEIFSGNLTAANPSLGLAEWISKLPVIYYPWGLNAVAIRFKSSLQENAKVHAMAEDVIEACHNGIVAWERQRDAQPILIEGVNDYSKTKERWDIIKELFEEEGHRVQGGRLGQGKHTVQDHKSDLSARLCLDISGSQEKDRSHAGPSYRLYQVKVVVSTIPKNRQGPALLSSGRS